MSRPRLFIAIVALVAALAAAAQAHAVQPPSTAPAFTVVARPLPPIEAPADEYFGRYRLSNLSVRNAISDMLIEGNSPLALPLQMGRIEAVRSALPAWALAYPHDPWVPSTTLAFAKFLIAKGVPSLYPSALAFLSYLVDVYPRTSYAAQAQQAIDGLAMFPDIDQLSGPTVGQLVLVRDWLPRPSIGRHR
jgi:hypothetical protein